MNDTIESKTYRDRPINLEPDGTRKWIYAKQPKGKWYRRRTIIAWILLAFLVLAPFIKVNGHPFMLLDIPNRRFYLFGLSVWAQDTYIIALVMLITVVSIVLFTVAYGRLWCGWACPQTIFLEFVFRRIEYLFDGNYRKGKPGTSDSPYAIPKHIVFILTSILITNIMLMWFIGPDGLKSLLTSPISDHWGGFLIMLAVSLFYYWIYAFFREQVCTMVCPYGRMQGVLLDSKSISVVYDYKRGEPRGAKSTGDCIDCKQCISVCPTGIDIRNGSQLECINCTACIDECGLVMKKVKRPKNLIRYDSVHGIETGKRSIANSRVYAYTIVLIVLFIILIAVVSGRTKTDTTLIRLTGSMFQQIDSTTYSNIYNAKIINKTGEDKKLNLKLISSEDGRIQVAKEDISVPAQQTFESAVIIKMKEEQLTGRNTKLKVGVYEQNNLLEIIEINFIGPVKKIDETDLR
jgi:cytochrome c oxidase accessory protein FixG